MAGAISPAVYTPCQRANARGCWDTGTHWLRCNIAGKIEQPILDILCFLHWALTGFNDARKYFTLYDEEVLGQLRLEQLGLHLRFIDA